MGNFVAFYIRKERVYKMADEKNTFNLNTDQITNNAVENNRIINSDAINNLVEFAENQTTEYSWYEREDSLNPYRSVDDAEREEQQARVDLVNAGKLPDFMLTPSERIERAIREESEEAVSNLVPETGDSSSQNPTSYMGFRDRINNANNETQTDYTVNNLVPQEKDNRPNFTKEPWEIAAEANEQAKADTTDDDEYIGRNRFFYEKNSWYESEYEDAPTSSNTTGDINITNYDTSINSGSGMSYYLPGFGEDVNTQGENGFFQSSPLLSTYSPRLFGAPPQLTHLNDMRLLSSADGSSPGPVGDFYLEKILQDAEIANIVVGRAVFTGGMNGIISGLRNLYHYAAALKKYGSYIYTSSPDSGNRANTNASGWSAALNGATLDAYKNALGTDDTPESMTIKTVTNEDGVTMSDLSGTQVETMVNSLGTAMSSLGDDIGKLMTALKTSFSIQQPFYTFDSDWYSYIQRVRMMINSFIIMLGLSDASVRIGDQMRSIATAGSKYDPKEDVWADYRFISPSLNGETHIGTITARDTQNGDTSQYVSFMIEPSGSSESYTNSIGESQIYSSVINSGSSIGNEIAFLTNSSQGAIDDLMVNFASKSINIAESILTNLSGGVGRFTAAVAGSMAKSYVGEHTIYPQIYQSSTATTTKSITIHLNAASGDPYTYMMDICVPLSYILCLVLPVMSKGSASAYAYPPIVQCNIPGLWGTRLGMVTQVDISKNPSGKDFSKNGYPLSLDVNITIADLQHVMVATPMDSPAMFLNNNTMFDYIAQCAGVDKYRVNGSARLITKLALGIQACSPKGVFTNIGNAIHNDLNTFANKMTQTYRL